MKTRIIVPALLVCFGLGLSGCATEEIVGGTIGASILGAQSRNNEIQQIYYLGVFDPQEQVPPAIYRVRLHGQASFISATKFTSGWLPADVIDSLGTNIGFNKQSGRIEITKGANGDVF